jgi:hypothetical protein
MPMREAARELGGAEGGCAPPRDFVLNGSEDVRPIRAKIRVTIANDWASSPSNLRVRLYADLTFMKSTRTKLASDSRRKADI